MITCSPFGEIGFVPFLQTEHAAWSNVLRVQSDELTRVPDSRRTKMMFVAIRPHWLGLVVSALTNYGYAISTFC